MKTQFDETLLKDLDSFIEYYKFTDDKEIYTNGSELIQVSRIKQWFDYNNDRRRELEGENEKSKNDIKLLLKENEIVHKDFNELSEKYFFEKTRIDKAIEYMENTIVFDAPSKMTLNDTYIIDSENYNKLLKILKGEEK